jgi:hypothetical protein
VTKPLVALALVALISAGCGSNGPAKTGNARTAMKFAECMRDNGVKQFPDPPASRPLTIDGVVNGSSLDTDSSAWKNAISACKDLQPAGFTGTKATASQQKQRLEFAQCIRENGVKDFPDPAPDAPMIDTNRIPSANQPGGMTILHAAMDACRDPARAAGASPP